MKTLNCHSQSKKHRNDQHWMKKRNMCKNLQMNYTLNMETHTTRFNTNCAMDVNKHNSMERPPPGTIWGTPKRARSTSDASDAMTEAFTNMASTIASAFSKPSPSSPVSNKSTPSNRSEVVGSQICKEVFQSHRTTS